jgi:hypothetical protein
MPLLDLVTKKGVGARMTDAAGRPRVSDTKEVAPSAGVQTVPILHHDPFRY